MNTSKLQITLFLFFTVLFAHSQDTIWLRDGSKQPGKIMEINAREIKYKKIDFLTGPSYVVPVSDAMMIVYKDRTRQVFNNNEPSSAKKPGAQDQTPVKVKYSGPRVGCTFIGPGTGSKYLIDKGKTPFVTQFGWQFETRIFTSTNGIIGLAELVPLLGGLEQGVVLPSASFLFGIRGKNGAEFAVGPNVSLSGFAMVLAIGTSFRVDDIYFPVNLAFVPTVKTSETKIGYNGNKVFVSEQTGFRISLLIGFNTKKKTGR